ncbi:MAG: peptidoglycan DD-metalloendopeptidase family protein [Actinomycetota bacterium]|nr:peptidoglycan DD-metalloendopeptidase family protein [Actinomycetota bacterium]
MRNDAHNRPGRKRTLALALTIALAGGGTALAQNLESERAAKEAELEEVERKGEVLSNEISAFSERITQLEGEVAVLRNREAIVAEQLRQTQVRLDREMNNLVVLRERLGRSMTVLRDRLVDIYKSDEPDALTVILDANGFDDLVNRYDYLDRVQDQDALIVGRVRSLRDQSQDTVKTVREARDAIAAKQAELERTRVQLEAREAELEAVRGQKAGALDQVDERAEELHGDISDLSDQIQAQLQESSSSTTSDPLPAGPIQSGSSGMIWPVNGPVVSPFGMRWGRLHAGIDIAVPAGTPIRAPKDGTIALAAPTSGYGNYTCIDHGGGLSTCHAHQSSFAITSGSVSQGDVIGYVGCTGHCYGDHLHFEVRINGVPVDPMGYL